MTQSRADIIALVRDDFPAVADRMEREPEGCFCHKDGDFWVAVRWSPKTCVWRCGSEGMPAWARECFDCDDPAKDCHMNCGPALDTKGGDHG